MEIHNWVKNLKKISIFFSIFFLLIVLVECVLAATRVFIFKKDFIGIVIKKIDSTTKDDCTRMTTHPFYGIVHDHRGRCEIKGGYADGSFVYYNKNLKKENSILILGGSSSDGFFKHYNQGDTWPYLLNKKIFDNNENYKIINGANGGFGTKQELLKLVTEVSNLDENVNIVISYSGLNDLPNYDHTNDESISNFPFIGGTLLYMLDRNIWINQHKDNIFFPNILSFLRYMKKNCYSCLDEIVLSEFTKTNLDFKKNKIKDVADRWLNNVHMMKKISESFGADFYVILEPALGLYQQEKYLNKNTNDSKLYNQIDDSYKKLLNETYAKFKNLCLEISFCIDASNLIIPENNFSNVRHLNQNGNKTVSDFIYNKLIK